MPRELVFLGTLAILCCCVMSMATVGRMDESQLRGTFVALDSLARDREFAQSAQPMPIMLGIPQAAGAETWVSVATAWGDYRITDHAYARHAEVAEIADALRNGWQPVKHHCGKTGRDVLVGLIYRAGAKAGTWALVVLESAAVAPNTIVTMFYPQPVSDPRMQLQRIIETLERDGCQGSEQYENMLHYHWALQ